MSFQELKECYKTIVELQNQLVKREAENKKLREALGAMEQILATYSKLTPGEFNSVLFHTGADKAKRILEMKDEV